MSRHATWVTRWATYTDWDQYKPTPDDAFAVGLGALLRRVAARTGTPEGVLILGDAEVTGALGLPAAEPTQVERELLGVALADAGWKCAGLRSWTTLRAEGLPVMHLGILPWMPVGTFGLAVPDGDSVWAGASCDGLGLWWELTGSAYLMSPGVAALRVLQDMQRARGGHPAWKSTAGPDPAAAAEGLWTPWTPAIPGGPGVWSYDARRAGLAAAINAEVAVGHLHHTGRRTFDRHTAGWWQIELPVWNDPRMPDPAGPRDESEIIGWLTTPTVALLEDLAAEGISAGIGVAGVLDSWTAKGSRLFRDWGQRMDQAYLFAEQLDSEPGPTVAAALKRGAAREAIGMMAAGTGSVQRPDWHHTINAVKRCNTWRRAWKIGQQHDVWPVVVDDDNLVYPQQVPGLVRGNKLGQVRAEMRTM